ncbi:MAG: Lrp/AsnC family transcriptional regulator [Oscillospiraceae bacterium]|nr:Lrp/AsnC family transcriptional regulator [Oscillospiraceae bacterium]MDY4191558.1 Lrp/AsnC family transcriptional regulator [Oscillospiraceae bacterium]
MDRLLNLLEENARYTNEQLAVMLGRTEEDVAAAIEAYEKSGVIRGYKALVDWDKTGEDKIFARIEIKVTPKKDFGFEEIARTIMEFEEVQSVYLMSGGYDLALTVSGRNFKEVALFVAHRLSPLDSVNSTATHFVLKKYKERGAILVEEEKDERRMTLL